VEKPAPVETQETAPRREAQARAEPRAEAPAPPRPAPPPTQAVPARDVQEPQEQPGEQAAAPVPSAGKSATAKPHAARESAAAAAEAAQPSQPPRPSAPQAQEVPPASAAAPELPSDSSRPAPHQTQQAAGAPSDEGRKPVPDVVASAAPSTGTATPAAGGTPQAALDRLTQEVRSIASMVLDRPPDGKSADVTAQLEVRYAEGGFINSIVVAESSGTPALDEQALAVARALRLPNAPPELRAQAFSVKFPVVFRRTR
jgi:protein TonB